MQIIPRNIEETVIYMVNNIEETVILCAINIEETEQCCAGGNLFRRKSIWNIEFTGKRDKELTRNIIAGQLKLGSGNVASSLKFYITCPEISFFARPVCQHPASGWCVSYYISGLCTVEIYDGGIAPVEDLELSVKIVSHIRMLILAYMVLEKIRESGSFITDAVNAVKL